LIIPSFTAEGRVGLVLIYIIKIITPVGQVILEGFMGSDPQKPTRETADKLL
jgi:hypothetical protein